MDVRKLRHFAAVAETLHFARAAERLHMTQPPLSQSILALERELGAALFARTKRRVALTAFGAQWLAHVQPALEALDALSEAARRLCDGTAGRLTLSFVSTADYNVLPPLVRRYAEQFPQVELSLTEATSDLQIPALLERRTQAGIIIPPLTALPSELDYVRLTHEPLVAAVPDLWVREGRIRVVDRRLTRETVLALPLVLFPRPVAPAFHDLVTGYFASEGVRPAVAQEAIQMQTIISLVSAGLGIALVPASLRNLTRAGVRYLDLADAPPTLETGLAWRRDDDTPTLRHLLQIVGQTVEREFPT